MFCNEPENGSEGNESSECIQSKQGLDSSPTILTVIFPAAEVYKIKTGLQ